MGSVGTLTQAPRPLAPLAVGVFVCGYVTAAASLAFLCRSVVGVWSPEHLGWDAIGPETRLEERTGPVRATTPGTGMLPGS
jgi:hypothetical protein